MKYYQLNCPAHTPIKLLFDQSSSSSKYGTIRKNTQKYYKRKRLIRCIYLILSPIMVLNYMFSELNCMLSIISPSRAMWSASTTGHPRSLSRLETVLLPVAIPPVKPTINMAPNKQQLATRTCSFGVYFAIINLNCLGSTGASCDYRHLSPLIPRGLSVVKWQSHASYRDSTAWQNNMASTTGGIILVIILSSNLHSTLQSTCSHFQGPPLPNRPFITVWHTPTELCKTKWNVTLDFSAFDFVVNPDQTWCGEHIVIFYNSQLGLYPYYDSNVKAVNGGLPQVNSSLQK